MTGPNDLPTLGLMFVLGLRHALDPDHIAVIDNVVFRMVDERPRLSPWTGTLFAAGHSVAVGAVALGVSLVARLFVPPIWASTMIDAVVVALLLFVGTLNLRALLHAADYRPIGWRAKLVPVPLRTSTHPVAVLAIGIVFGLVFDTATQAAAWGAAATTKGGFAAAGAIASAFAAGMILADTVDSQVVSRLLRSRRTGDGRVRRYRRGVGWLIVALSYGMALFAVLQAIGLEIEPDDRVFTAIGAAAATLVASLLARARWIGRVTKSPRVEVR